MAILISVPLQYNLDTGIGPNDADRSLLNVQPVIPFSLNDNRTLISGTIIPLVNFEAPAPGLDDTSGVGPTAVALRQSGGWTVGALANHIRGVNEPEGREQVNGTFILPFVTCTTPDAWTFSLNSDSTYDWNMEQWTVPVNAAVSKLVSFGKQPVSFALGYREYLEPPPGRAGPGHSLRGHVPVSEGDAPLREGRDAQHGPASD